MNFKLQASEKNFLRGLKKWNGIPSEDEDFTRINIISIIDVITNYRVMEGTCKKNSQTVRHLEGGRESEWEWYCERGWWERQKEESLECRNRSASFITLWNDDNELKM